MNKERNSNIEIVRIISMVMIVISHYCTHGIGKTVINALKPGFNRFIVEFLTLGNVGVILFVLISGYYLINSTRVNVRRICNLVLQVSFYSIAIYIVLVISKTIPFGITEFIKSVFPITYKRYWFATAYFLLYLFHTFINILLNTLTRKQHFLMNLMFFMLFSLLPTLTTADFYGNEFIQFIMFYSFGAYISKYPDNILSKKQINHKALAVSILIIAASIITLDLLGTDKPVFAEHSLYFLSRTSPFVIILSIALFDVFTQKEPFTNHFINSIGSLVFGVYLISDNIFIRPVLWEGVFKCSLYVGSSYLLVHLLISALLTVAACTVIEYLRKELLEKRIDVLFSGIYKNLQSKIDNFMGYISESKE